MENSSREIVYPIIEQICEVNRRMIQEFGGLFIPPDNLLNPNALEYMLNAIKFPITGIHNYTTVKEKAAAIAYQIISRHVFYDGNKRTGTHVAWEFLHANGIRLTIDSSIIELTISIARGNATMSEFLQWLHKHQEE